MSEDLRKALIERAHQFDWFKTSQTELWDWVMEARAALTSSQDGWRPIESAPKEQKIDLWVVWPAWEDDQSGGKRMADCIWDKAENDWQAGTFRLGQYMARPYATHWMPISPPPPVKEMGL
jgi:hypothetical protein